MNHSLEHESEILRILGDLCKRSVVDARAELDHRDGQTKTETPQRTVALEGRAARGGLTSDDLRKASFLHGEMSALRSRGHGFTQRQGTTIPINLKFRISENLNDVSVYFISKATYDNNPEIPKQRAALNTRKSYPTYPLQVPLLWVYVCPCRPILRLLTAAATSSRSIQTLPLIP